MDNSQIPPKWTSRLARLSDRLPARAKVIGGLVQGVTSALAALIAYLPTKPLGLREGFWASITAIAVAQSELSATQSSAKDQFAGAAIGGVVSVGMVMLIGEHLAVAVYALAVVVSMLVCWLVNVSSAARISGSTVTIILLVPHTGSVGTMMLSRIAEVGWGVVVGIAVVWLANKTHTATRGSPPA